MALSFLNKKIWHPGSFANMEKTWVTEQKYREVERRAIEKAKKIKEEKVFEEMKKIQVEKGLIPAYHLNRLDFMYQCPQPENGENKNENEEFLLGKRLDDDDNEENYIKKKKKKIIPKFADTYANPQNEEFVRIHEDPLYLILKEEKKQRKEIEQNPYKMKMILNDLKNDLCNNNNNKKGIKLDENEEKYNKSNNESEEETEKYNEEEYINNKEIKKSYKHHHYHHSHRHHHHSHKHKSKNKHKNSYHHYHHH